MRTVCLTLSLPPPSLPSPISSLPSPIPSLPSLLYIATHLTAVLEELINQYGFFRVTFHVIVLATYNFVRDVGITKFGFSTSFTRKNGKQSFHYLLL